MAQTIILYAIPVFFLLICIELLVDKYRKTGYYRLNDALTSLSLGIISRTYQVLFLGFAVIVFTFISEYFSIPQLSKESVFTWILGFVLYDFFYYWFHRTSHKINFLWAGHVVHHQSEDYNLTTALRQTSTTIFAWVFYIPSFLIGIPAEVFFVSGALNLLYQFWVHTQHIGRLGWMEKIMVTPSHHRVHHGQNRIYIDKNHGGVFILWDKIFGTFQQELESEPVIYGVSRPVNSFNPIWANIHTWSSLITDAFHTKQLKDKLRIWFMPTGWRPEDVKKSHPMVRVKAKQLLKYDPEQSTPAKYYGILQYTAALVTGVVFLLNIQNLSFTWKLISWLLITAPLLTSGMILGNRPFAISLDSLRLIISIIVLSMSYQHFSTQVLNGIISYLVISVIGLLALLLTSKKELKATTKTS